MSSQTQDTHHTDRRFTPHVSPACREPLPRCYPPAHGLAQSRCTGKFWLMRAGGGQPGAASWGSAIDNGIARPNPLKSPFLMHPGLYP